MDDESIKKAEGRGYSRGYAAGSKRKALTINAERMNRQRAAFWNRAFLALLPAAMLAQNWTLGNKPITSGDDRVDLARRWADKAAKLQKF